jgi:hypothetical protein
MDSLDMPKSDHFCFAPVYRFILNDAQFNGGTLVARGVGNITSAMRMSVDH